MFGIDDAIAAGLKVLRGLTWSFVLPLVGERNPGAVIGGVVAVHVNALDRKALRALSHIRKERFEAVKPPLANLDAASAVRFPVVMLGVSAPGLDRAPGAVLAGLG